jgi:hypothetical protein
MSCMQVWRVRIVGSRTNETSPYAHSDSHPPASCMHNCPLHESATTNGIQKAASLHSPPTRCMFVPLPFTSVCVPSPHDCTICVCVCVHICVCVCVFSCVSPPLMIAPLPCTPTLPLCIVHPPTSCLYHCPLFWFGLQRPPAWHGCSTLPFTSVCVCMCVCPLPSWLHHLSVCVCVSSYVCVCIPSPHDCTIALYTNIASLCNPPTSFMLAPLPTSPK